MNVQVDPSATSSLWKSLGIAGIVVFAIWLLSWLIIDYSIVDITERGTFGDKFGLCWFNCNTVISKGRT